MKTRFSILAILVILAFLGCKNEPVAVKMNYEYSDQPSLVDCKGADSLLVKEVLYTFESDNWGLAPDLYSDFSDHVADRDDVADDHDGHPAHQPPVLGLLSRQQSCLLLPKNGFLKLCI